MLIVNPLFRRLDYEEGVKLNNSNKILLKPEFFKISSINSDYNFFINDKEILQSVKKCLVSDKIMKNYKQLFKTDSREFSKFLQDWNFENGLLLYCRKVYISKDAEQSLRR